MATTFDGALDNDTDWAPLSANERETFYAAIERHRRRAWRVTLASTIATFVAAFVFAVLTAPLFYALIALAFDLVNIVTPAPNLIGQLMSFYDARENAPAPVALSEWLRWLAIAAAPGLIVMGLVLAGLRRAIRAAATLEAASLQHRELDASRLAEQRFGNVVHEMALAGNLPVPKTFVVEAGLLNATVLGTDERHASIVISSALLMRLSRAELQGVAAHLIASIANGDVPIGLRAALTLSLFNLMSRFALLFNDQRSLAHVFGVIRALLWPTQRNLAVLIDSITESFGGPPAHAAKEPTTRIEKIREGLKLIVAGPVIMAGFFGGIAGAAVLGPLLAFAWRQRKFMADATAVQLTRDPDTLARALEKMSSAGSGALTPWTAHMGITASSSNRSVLTSTPVPLCPSYARRLRALRKLGATVSLPPTEHSARMVLFLVAAYGAIGVLIAILLPLLAYVSLMLSTLFLGIPLSILHLLLRWVGH